MDLQTLDKIDLQIIDRIVVTTNRQGMVSIMKKNGNRKNDKPYESLLMQNPVVEMSAI